MTHTPTPLVTIVMPIYNVEAYLKRCIDSVLAQDYQTWELILVDDGSPDGCPALCDAYQRTDTRIRVIHQKNAGLAAARNSGLKEYNGELVIFLDSDDAWHPRLLSTAVQKLQATDADILSFGLHKSNGFDSPDVPLPSPLPVTNTTALREFLNMLQTPLHCGGWEAWSAIYKRDAIGDTRFIPGIHFEDFPFFLEVLSHCRRFANLEAPLYAYTCRQDSIMRQSLKLQDLRDYQTGIQTVTQVYANHPERPTIASCFLPPILAAQMHLARKINTPDGYKILQDELTCLNADGWLLKSAYKLKNWWRINYLLKHAKLPWILR